MARSPQILCDGLRCPIVLDTFLDVLKDEVGYENWDWVGPRGSCPLLPTTAALE